ncbi:formylglycine-generating enzyme-like isoform X2 [Hyposmocoma kahamanoa]|uniref:formylglycine-generating enzyme-like isoform X2 n=1 Tax=Hyposmocoma kahamanoa TaxID=1477025 RepID=UPI000E6D6003|nr:formylglycine-generating enzyme-like isoform X2 [Hyposmocoma kahamanoa]
MVLIPAGIYQVGTDDVIIETDNEGPKRMVELKSFYLDKYEVSNREFSRFVAATNYKTEAETFGESFVFQMFLNSTFRETLKNYRAVAALWWYSVNGTDWMHPHGPDSNISDLMDHPVVHVSWRDALTYCAWRDARLPTEAEWEGACRGGLYDTIYPWGNKLFPDKKYMANIWQGTFPNYNSAKDGYIGTNPVMSFPPNGFGLYNMVGNVWEWTEDPWPNTKSEEKVKKGGSFLCHISYCYRYRCSARTKNTLDSSAVNLGFRCAKSLD